MTNATLGCDYSFARPSMSSLGKYSFVVRYAGGTANKELTPAEAKQLAAAGKRIGLNFESSGKGGSYAQGQADAHYADAHFRSCGFTGNFVVFFSIDYDAPVASQDDYFRGIVSVLGQARTDVYASRAIILRLRSLGLIRPGQSGWRPSAWGWAGGAGSPSEFTAIQGGYALGGQVDEDTAYVDINTFTYVPGGAPTPPTPAPAPAPSGNTTQYRASHNTYTPLSVDGVFGRNSVMALQYVLGVAVDGYFGAVSIKALQHILGVSADGVVGHVTVEALQKRVGAGQDGVWGKLTTEKVQAALNAGKLY